MAGVEVTDVGPGMLPLRDTRLDDTHGRGLILDDALSDAWGMSSDQGSKTVWFELKASPAGDVA